MPIERLAWVGLLLHSFGVVAGCCSGYYWWVWGGEGFGAGRQLHSEIVICTPRRVTILTDRPEGPCTKTSMVRPKMDLDEP